MLIKHTDIVVHSSVWLCACRLLPVSSRSRSVKARLNMAAPSPPQYLDTMKKAWQHVSDQWPKVGERIAGPAGHAAVNYESVKRSHPPFPIMMAMLAGCVILTNGATLMIWGTAAPLAIWVLNVNYPQTRKSTLGSIVERMAKFADAHVRELFEAEARKAK